MNKSYKYITNISNEEGTILLYDQIGSDIDANGNIVYGIDGSSFANEMQYLQTVCKKINVRINSIGGNVLDGYSIVSAILNSTVRVDTYIDGLAASIAGVIAIAGKKCYMMDYGTMMLHNPSGGNDQAVLGLVKNTLVTLFSNRTSKTAEEITVMMDKETWLSASEALNMGLVDEVVSSNKKIRIKQGESLFNVAKIYNKLLIKKPKMEAVANILKLKNDAAEHEIVTAIASKDSEIIGLKESNQLLCEKIKNLEEKELAAKTAMELEAKERATTLVNKAFEDGKLKEEEKQSTISLAIANFSAVENMLSKISNIKISEKVFNIKDVAKKVTNGVDVSTWNIRDWEKKNPKGLAELKNNSPEEYNELFKYYKK